MAQLLPKWISSVGQDANRILASDGNGKTIWQPAPIGLESSTTTQQNISTNTYTRLTGIRITVNITGPWLAIFSASIEINNNNALSSISQATFSIYSNGSIVSASERTVYGTKTDIRSGSTQAIVTLNSSQFIDVYFKTPYQITVWNQTLSAIKAW